MFDIDRGDTAPSKSKPSQEPHMDIEFCPHPIFVSLNNAIDKDASRNLPIAIYLHVRNPSHPWLAFFQF